jgi:hypothetical protein
MGTCVGSAKVVLSSNSAILSTNMILEIVHNLCFRSALNHGPLVLEHHRNG